MQIEQVTRVADVAAGHPATIKVFQKFGIDFCCGGQRPLGEVCGEKGISFEEVQRDLGQAIAAAPAPVADWTTEPLDVLTRHIVDRYHVWLREELPRLAQMMKKVEAVHGERHPELAETGGVFRAIHDDLMPHMMKEEHVLFPYIARMAMAAAQGQSLGGSPFGTVGNPISMMEMEHETVGRDLERLRALTRGYTPPADGCNTYKGLFHGLAELERELHEHIHVENNILHPRALALEEKLTGQRGRLVVS